MFTLPFGFNKPVVSGGGGSGNAATYLAKDTTTQGNWVGVYGADGYWIEQGYSATNTSMQSLPAYVTRCDWGGTALGYDWATESNARSLTKPDGITTTRQAVTFYGPGSTCTLSVTFTALKKIRIYNGIYDGGRVIAFAVKDRDTGATLNSQTEDATEAANGVWYSYSIIGNIDFVYTLISGGNCTAASGIFFDP
ncbi:MAG: hypothetical protein JWN40_3847 [Phycisphaerales bacterium]|nr:hypothetical protein [Phycisphaerales bacterium]